MEHKNRDNFGLGIYYEGVATFGANNTPIHTSKCSVLIPLGLIDTWFCPSVKGVQEKCSFSTSWILGKAHFSGLICIR